ncbi:hypothetical protein PR202_gb26368 [Eleusine coracana subsp. coracana]|uniref:Uncharacterized protein n=1 Tax=Eleusine coracana subsp. coracana TaxID=191504 RepID=A0AAV5FRN9_ELECO|nr:hypothetical protein PR202_gb26368 [Eleusine coracana subsp. coracana]
MPIKVNVRCSCNTLKQEWICQDVLKEYRKSGRDPKEVPKNQFGVGLLACGENCIKKMKATDSELHLRKSLENKVQDITIMALFFVRVPFSCSLAPLWRLPMCQNAGSDVTADKKRLKFPNSRFGQYYRQ